MRITKYSTRWVADTPIGTFSVITDWNIPRSELGRFKPCWNGCGIGPSFKTLPSAKLFCQQYANQLYAGRLKEERRKLVELVRFAGHLSWHERGK